LIRNANTFLFTSLARKSIQSYKTALNRYVRFCKNFKLKPTLTELNLRLFATFLATQVRPDTIRTYLSGLKFFASISGVTLDTENMPTLSYTMRGIRRANIVAKKAPKSPITMLHLQRILWFLRNCELDTWERRLWWAACLLAFYGLLRSAEYCCLSKTSFYTASTLLLSDIRLSRDSIVITIRQSKTDPFHVGQSVTVGPTHNEFCPVIAMRAFLSTRGHTPGPLFVFRNHTLLTRLELSNFLNQCFLGTSNISTHSFRIGGASALASVGVPVYVIQAIGRWSSDCFKIYLRFPGDFRKSLAVRMSKPTNKK